MASGCSKACVCSFCAPIDRPEFSPSCKRYFLVRKDRFRTLPITDRALATIRQSGDLYSQQSKYQKPEDHKNKA